MSKLCRMSRGKKYTIIAVSVIMALIILCIAAFFGVGAFFYSLALNPDDENFSKLSVGFADDIGSSHDRDPHGVLKESGEWFKQALKDNTAEQVRIDSEFDGIKLAGYRLNNAEQTSKWAICIHGYRGKSSNIAYAGMNFYNRGYNVLMPDLRGHGDSEGDYIGMGWHDRLDIISWINYIIEEDKDAEIALYGVSMGSATVMMTTGEKLPANIKVAIADCGYTSVYDQFAFVLDEIVDLPEFPIMTAAEIFVKANAGYSMKEASAVNQVKKSVTPTLFVHGKKDGFVPFFMLDKVYAAASCEKSKLAVDGAGHGESAFQFPDMYWDAVWKWVDKYIA